MESLLPGTPLLLIKKRVYGGSRKTLNCYSREGDLHLNTMSASFQSDTAFCEMVQDLKGGGENRWVPSPFCLQAHSSIVLARREVKKNKSYKGYNGKKNLNKTNKKEAKC